MQQIKELEIGSTYYSISQYGMNTRHSIAIHCIQSNKRMYHDNN